MEKTIQISREAQFTSLLIPLIEEFVVRSGDYERKVSSIIKQVNEILRLDTGSLWVIWDGINPIGYAFAQVVTAEYGDLVCLVHQLFVMPRYGDSRIPIMMDATIGQWALNRKAKKMFFYTRRDERAFRKLLLKGWEVDSIVMKRDLI